MIGSLPSAPTVPAAPRMLATRDHAPAAVRMYRSPGVSAAPAASAPADRKRSPVTGVPAARVAALNVTGVWPTGPCGPCGPVRSPWLVQPAAVFAAALAGSGSNAGAAAAVTVHRLPSVSRSANTSSPSTPAVPCGPMMLPTSVSVATPFTVTVTIRLSTAAAVFAVTSAATARRAVTAGVKPWMPWMPWGRWDHGSGRRSSKSFRRT